VAHSSVSRHRFFPLDFGSSIGRNAKWCGGFVVWSRGELRRLCLADLSRRTWENKGQSRDATASARLPSSFSAWIPKAPEGPLANFLPHFIVAHSGMPRKAPRRFERHVDWSSMPHLICRLSQTFAAPHNAGPGPGRVKHGHPVHRNHEVSVVSCHRKRLGRCCTIIVVMTGPAGSCVMRRHQLTFFRILAILSVGLSMVCVLRSMVFRLCYTHPCSVKRWISPDFGIKVVSKSESADAKAQASRTK
jgi:hypothetical protein